MHSTYFRRVLFLCLLLHLGSALSAQKILLKGSVHTEDNKGAGSLLVRLDEKRETHTDSLGHFFFTNVSDGNHTVSLSGWGITPQSRQIQLPLDSNALLFVINYSFSQLTDVIVTGGKNNYNSKVSDFVAKMPLSNMENPQIYTTITSAQLQDQLIVDYRDAFRNAAGVNSLEQVSNGRTSAFIRGFRTGNFLRNGMATTQLSLTEVANLDKIEVIKGPSGTLFGSSFISYGGAVNRVTKTPNENTASSITYIGGSYGLSRLSFDVNTPLNKDKTVLLRVNGVRHSSGSFQDFGFQRNYFLAPTLQYTANNKLTFFFDGEFFQNHGTNLGLGFSPNTTTYPNWKSYKDLKNIYYKTYSSDDVTSTLKGSNIFTGAHYKINEKWTLHAMVNYSGMDARDQLQMFITLIPNDSILRKIQRYEHHYYAYNGQINVNGDFNIGKVRNRVLLGVDAVANITQPTYIKNFVLDSVAMFGKASYITMDRIEKGLESITTTNPYKSSQYNYGAYATDIINFTSKLLLMLSGRYDYYDNKGTTYLSQNVTTGTFHKSTFSPKAGLVYQLVQDQVSLFANYLNGFTYNSTTNKQGDLFKPEHANQWETGVKFDLFHDRLYGSMSYYDIKVSDKIRTDPSDATNYIQDGTQSSKGMDIELNAVPVEGWKLTAGYGYNSNKFTQAAASIVGNTASHAPKHIVNFWSNYRFRKGAFKGFGWGLGMYSNSDSYYDDANTFIVPKFIVFNTVVSYTTPKWMVSLKADNLGNEKYWGPWGAAQPPRNYSASLSVNF